MKLGKNSKYFYSAKSEASFSKEYHVTTNGRHYVWKVGGVNEAFRSELLKVSKRSKARWKCLVKGFSILSLSGTSFLLFSNFLRHVSSFERVFNVHLYYRVLIKPIKSRDACRKDDISDLIEDVLTAKPRNLCLSLSLSSSKVFPRASEVWTNRIKTYRVIVQYHGWRDNS